jgi:energy-converting hydrogenase A subunit M
MNIFDDRIYVRDVVRPVLKALGINRDELRDARQRVEASDAVPVNPQALNVY